MLGLETMVALPIALTVGLPHQAWFFWTVIGMVCGWMALLLLAWFVVARWTPAHEGMLPESLRQFRDLAEEFLRAGLELFAFRTLRLLVPVAAYMLCYVIELYAIITAVGIHGITFVDTAGIYAAVVLAVILIPIPTEIGLTEFAGLGALVAFGAVHSTAAIVMLSLRILATGMTTVAAVVILLSLRSSVERAEQPLASPVGPGARRLEAVDEP